MTSRVTRNRARPTGVTAHPGAVRDTIPEATVARLTGYLRVLAPWDADAGATISSEELAGLAGVNPAKLRKDLSYVGSRGTRGVGYDAVALRSALETVLGAHDTYPVAVVGVGHLGSALAGYSGFAERGFPLRVLLDADPAKIGRTVAGLPVIDVADAHAACRAADVTIGIISTPESAAQQAAGILVDADVRSILNFTPSHVTVPDDVEVRHVDLALELHMLAFHAARRGRSPARLEAL